MSLNKFISIVFISMLLISVLVSCTTEKKEDKFPDENTTDSEFDESFNDIKEENTTGVSDSGEVIVSAKNVSKLYSGMTIGDAVEILGFRGYEYGSSREINVRTWHLDDGSHLNLYYVIDYTKFGSSISFSEIDQYAICTSAYIIKENETTTLFGSD